MRGPRVIARLIDLRAGEARFAILSFLVLALASAGHTVLETARDALLVTRLPPREFGIVYIAVAVCALPAATLLAHVARRWDVRHVLVTLLGLASAGALVYAALPVRRPVVVAFYVTVGLIASAVFPQFWLLIGSALTVGQSRRLIGPIASAGVLGGVLGAAGAAAAVPWLPVRGLIALAAGLLALAAGATFFVPGIPPARRTVATSSGATPPLATSMSAFREEPFLLRVAVLVAATTATALVIDYFFKFTIARTVPGADRAAFIARYYAIVNVIALVVQLFVGSALVRGLGVATAMILTPLFSVLGGTAALVAGGLAVPVLHLERGRREPAQLDQPADHGARVPPRISVGARAREALHRRGPHARGAGDHGGRASLGGQRARADATGLQRHRRLLFSRVAGLRRDHAGPLPRTAEAVGHARHGR